MAYPIHALRNGHGAAGRASFSSSSPQNSISGHLLRVPQRAPGHIGSNGAVLRAAAVARPQSSQMTLEDKLSAAPLIFPAMTLAGAAAALAVGLPDMQVCLLLAMPTLCFHVVVPLLDFLLGPQPAPMRNMEGVHSGFLPRALPVLYCVAQMGAIVAISLAAGAPGVPLHQLMLLAVSLGMTFAVGASAAHELVHSRDSVHQVASQLMLCSMWLWSYSRSHHYHHKHVGTDEDHTTAAAGESLYAFIIKYVGGNWVVAMREEAVEARRKGRAVWGLKNQVVLGVAGQVSISVIAGAVGGLPALAVQLGAASMAIIYLVTIDFILHSGLTRTKLADGSWSPMTAHNSFSSPFLLENAVLFKVLNHADHHLHTAKPYGILGFVEPRVPVSPQVVPGVPMIAITLVPFVPFLWNKLVASSAKRANMAHAEEVLALA